MTSHSLSKGIMPCLRQFLLFYCKKVSLNKKNNKKPNDFITDNNSYVVSLCKNAFWITKIWGQVDNLLPNSVRCKVLNVPFLMVWHCSHWFNHFNLAYFKFLYKRNKICQHQHLHQTKYWTRSSVTYLQVRATFARLTKCQRLNVKYMAR